MSQPEIIVYPWKAPGDGSGTRELRLSLRSVARFWQRCDRGWAPLVFIVGPEKPDGLKGRLAWIEEKGDYIDAVERVARDLTEWEPSATPLQYTWMNDDIFVLAPCSWEMLHPVRSRGEIRSHHVRDYFTGRWARKILAAGRFCVEKGLRSLDFSTHLPYPMESGAMAALFDDPEFRKTLAANRYKFPVETAFGNWAGWEPRDCADVARQWKGWEGILGKRFLNVNDSAAKADKARWLRFLEEIVFPDKCCYER